MLYNSIIPPLLIVVTLFCGGCATVDSGKEWGSRVSVFPGYTKTESAFSTAMKDPDTWAPLIGATIFRVLDMDRQVSQWAFNNTPVFGSPLSAIEASDLLQDTAGVGMIVTALMTPVSDDKMSAMTGRLKGFGVEALAVGITSDTTGIIKGISGRRRPDGSDNNSFPSAHSSRAFSYAALGSRNLESIKMGEGSRRALDYGFTAIAMGVAWARVEGRAHYPSDVLAGAALGNFLALFIHDTLLGREYDDLTLHVDPGQDGITVRFTMGM